MKNNKMWPVLGLTLAMGLLLPFGFRYIVFHAPFYFPTLGVMCVVWPGYGLWLSLWASRDIQKRQLLVYLFAGCLAVTSWVWFDSVWYMGILACLVLLLICVAVMHSAKLMRS